MRSLIRGEKAIVVKPEAFEGIDLIRTTSDVTGLSIIDFQYRLQSHKRFNKISQD